MIASISRSRIRLALLLLATGVFAASCQLVGQGHLNVSNDQSGIGADNTEFRAYAAGPGDPFPPAGYLALHVRGDDFGRPPSYGMNGYLYLVGTAAACPQSEGAPEAFTLSQVSILGIATVSNGTVNQFFTVADTTANRHARWGLMEINELAGYPGQHLLHRCGSVAWTGPVTASACALRQSLEGQPLTPSVGFALNADTKWQICNGGGAAGSIEKMMFYTANGSSTWALISRTTLGNPPPEPAVGEMPNNGSAAALFFNTTLKGWLGLNGPGHNLLRSTDGGHNWQEVVVAGLDSGEPVTSIAFTDAMHGSFVSSDGTFTTDDGGATWDAP